MRKLTRFISTGALCLLALGVTAIQQEIQAQDAPTPAGHWDGAIMVPDAPLEINIDLRVDEEGLWSGDISIPAQMAEDVPLADVAVEGSKVSFRIPEVPGDPSSIPAHGVDPPSPPPLPPAPPGPPCASTCPGRKTPTSGASSTTVPPLPPPPPPELSPPSAPRFATAWTVPATEMERRAKR